MSADESTTPRREPIESAWSAAFATGIDSKPSDTTSVNTALDRLLKSTGARAVGLWRIEQNYLVQVGFRTAHDMPSDVREGFRAATRQLPLSRTDLGVVKAAVSGHPTPARLSENASDEKSGDLSGSATWLERFACQQSLAVPIYRNQQLRGVIAISTPETFGEQSRTWIFLVDLATRIGEMS